MTAFFLPRWYQITPDPGSSLHFEAFLLQLSATLQSGVRLVQLRAKSLARQEHLLLARKVLDLCRAHGARLILNGCSEIALAIGCDGVHLSSRTLMSLTKRPLPDSMLVSAACHNAEQLAWASQIGVNFATLSPVFPTRTHPDAEPLGWQRFVELVASAKIPVFALGGMQPQMLDEVKKAGAWGIAAISSTWCGEGLAGVRDRTAHGAMH